MLGIYSIHNTHCKMPCVCLCYLALKSSLPNFYVIKTYQQNRILNINYWNTIQNLLVLVKLIALEEIEISECNRTFFTFFLNSVDTKRLQAKPLISYLLCEERNAAFIGDNLKSVSTCEMFIRFDFVCQTRTFFWAQIFKGLFIHYSSLPEYDV